MSRLAALRALLLFAAVAIGHVLAPEVAAQGPLPDLVVTTVRLEPQAGGACHASLSQLGLRVTITNVGTAGAGAFQVDVNGQRQTVGSLAATANTVLWFGNPVTGTNVVTVDVLQQVFESNEGNNVFQSTYGSLASTPACTPTFTPTASPTQTATQPATPSPTMTPTVTASGTVTPTQTPTGTATPTVTTTAVPVVPATATSIAGGIQMSINPRTARIRPGETVAIQVRLDWNPSNVVVTFTHAAADDLSKPLATNAAWSPTSMLTGAGVVTELILGTTSTLAPGVYTINVTGTSSLGANVQKATFEVVASSTLFDNEVLRRNEFLAFGPELMPPYRGGDTFFYQPRVTALLQWRPESNTYVNANTSELLDLSAVGPAHYRLPATIKDDGTAGDLTRSFNLRLGEWMTDPAINARYVSPPPGHTGAWDLNGSVTLYGLPVSRPHQIGPYIVQRFQRAVFRHWIADTPAHPEWRDSVAVIPLEQAALNFMPEIDPIAAGQIVRAARQGQPPAFSGFWELDGSTANGFASVALEAEDTFTARVAIGNPTGMWLEATLIGPVGTQAELAAGQTIVSDWPGLPPLSWIVEPGQRLILHVHPNQVHANPDVRAASVHHVWMRPTARAAMARVAQGMAAVGVPEVGELHGARLTAYYRALLGAASRAGSGSIGCLVALDGNVNAGDERQFGADLSCAVSAPITGYVMAEAAAAIGVGVDPGVVSGRLNPGALIGRIGADPATGWYFWNLQLDGREPGGRIRVSHTGAASGG